VSDVRILGVKSVEIKSVVVDGDTLTWLKSYDGLSSPFVEPSCAKHTQCNVVISLTELSSEGVEPSHRWTMITSRPYHPGGFISDIPDIRRTHDLILNHEHHHQYINDYIYDP
jgi:hypothetical protein